MTKIRAKFLLIACVVLWTTGAHAQSAQVILWGADYATIVVSDTVGFRADMVAIADSLVRKDGLILDVRKLPPEKIWSMAIWQTLQKEMVDYTKPFVILMDLPVDKNQPLAHWMKERHWSRFEPSGSISKAEAKVRTLHGRHLREGQDRMDWLMQQQGTTK